MEEVGDSRISPGRMQVYSRSTTEEIAWVMGCRSEGVNGDDMGMERVVERLVAMNRLGEGSIVAMGPAMGVEVM